MASQDKIFEEVKQQFIKTVNLSEGTTAKYNAVAKGLKSSRNNIVRLSKGLVGNVSGLRATSFLRVDMAGKVIKKTLNATLTLPVGGMLRQYPVELVLPKNVEIPNLEALVEEAYIMSRKKDEYHFTSSELDGRFTEALNYLLPKNSNVGVSAVVNNPHTPKVSFSLVFTDLK